MYLSVIVQSVSKLEIDQLLPTMAAKVIAYKLCGEISLLKPNDVMAYKNRKTQFSKNISHPFFSIDELGFSIFVCHCIILLQCNAKHAHKAGTEL